MNTRDRIAEYYSAAKEFIKQNNPKAARAHVLAILNCALKTYKNAKSITIKAKTAAFLDTWIAVSKDLYSFGITDYVLECFGLPLKSEQALPKAARVAEKPKPKKQAAKNSPVESTPPNDDIDISGLIDPDDAKTQGWRAELFDKYKKAVVEITAFDAENGSSGTGFIISKKGYLLTNDHIVFNEVAQGYYPKANMTFAGQKKSYKINILFSDKKSDVALCSFNPAELGEFSVISRISDYSQLMQGADCLVIGNAFGMGLAPLAGVVRFTKNQEGDLVYAAQSNPGDSGGPVLNRRGECIGINKSKTVAVNNVSADGFANATPMDTIESLLTKWCEGADINL